MSGNRDARPRRAALAGVVAAQVMERPAHLQKAAGLPVRQDIFAETGAILHAPRRMRRFAGWVGHACTAALVAMGYAAFFDAVRALPPSVLWGMATGTVHFAVGGFVVAAYPLLHPDVSATLPVPGFSYWRIGGGGHPTS